MDGKKTDVSNIVGSMREIKIKGGVTPAMPLSAVTQLSFEGLKQGKR